MLHSYKVFRPDVEGGIPFAIASLAGAQDDIESKVLVARAKGWGRRYIVDGIAVEAVGSLGTVFSTPIAPTFPFALLRQSDGFDVVVHHAPFPLADLTLPWIPQHVALVVYWHAEIMQYSLLKGLLGPAFVRTLQRADKIVVSDAEHIETSDALRPFGGKCAVVPFGIDVNEWMYCTDDERRRADEIRARHPRSIVAVGRLVSYKGFSVLVEAMRCVDGHLIVVGEGSLRPALEAQIANLGLKHKVNLVGRLTNSDLKAYLHAAAVFALPSISSAETFGIVQLEAMAAGLPIVNTKLHTGVPRVARHGCEALTVTPGEPTELGAALSKILDDTDLATRLGDAGRQRVLTQFSREAYLSRMTSVFRDAMARRGASCKAI